jgi:hypothetical protein
LLDEQTKSQAMRSLLYRRPRAERGRSITVATLLVIGVVLSVPLYLELTHVADAATQPKIVWGYVYDEAGQPLAGATVTVTMKYGTGTTRSEITADPTESDGYYMVTFETNQWEEGDTIEVSAMKSGGEVATNSTGATPANAGDQQIDIHFSEIVIPEFGNALAVVPAFGAIVVFLLIGNRKIKK